MKIKIFIPFPDIGSSYDFNYAIDCWLKDHKIDFESVPFNRSHEADWVVFNIHDYYDCTIAPNMLVDLDDRITPKLKSGKAGILFWYPGELNDFEGMATIAQPRLLGKPPTQDQIKNLTQADQYPIKVLVCNNARRLTIHQVAEDKNKSIYTLLQDDVIAEPLRFFDWQLTNFISEESDQIIQLNNFNWNKTKSFMCLNGADKLHRRMMINAIRERNLQSHGLISYVCRYGVIEALDEECPCDDLPIILDYDKVQLECNDRWMNTEIYNDSWINVVTEAWPWKGTEGRWSGVNSPIEITEKTFKPMLQLQPFIVFGSNDTLSKLHEWGYHTFDKIFDESYDTIQSVDDRLDAIVNQLAIWVARPLSEKRTMTESVLDSLSHNQKTLMRTQRSYSHSSDFHRLLKAIPLNNLQIELTPEK